MSTHRTSLLNISTKPGAFLALVVGVASTSACRQAASTVASDASAPPARVPELAGSEAAPTSSVPKPVVEGGVAATGSLCVRRKGRDVGEFLAPSTEEAKRIGRLRNGRFEISVDGRAAITVSADDEVCDLTVPLDGRHMVRITSDGEPYASFPFEFTDGGASACLAYKPGYGTWSLQPSGPRCGPLGR